MIFTLFPFACQSEAPLPNQSTDSSVLNEQDRYADFVRGLQFKSEAELLEEVHAQEEIVTEIDSTVLSPLRQAIIGQDSASLFSLFSLTASVFVPQVRHRPIAPARVYQTMWQRRPPSCQPRKNLGIRI